jgi:hypothetical protein
LSPQQQQQATSNNKRTSKKGVRHQHVEMPPPETHSFPVSQQPHSATTTMSMEEQSAEVPTTLKASQQQPSPQAGEWVKVVGRHHTPNNPNKKKSSMSHNQKKTKKSTVEWEQKLDTAVDSQERLRLLLKPRLSEEQRITEVRSSVVSLNLCSKARQQPMKSWKFAVNSWSGGKDPLHISIITPTKAEIFYDARHAEMIMNMPTDAYLHPPTLLMTEKDVERRARSYLKGYFKELRMASLRGFPKHLMLAVLKRAEEILPTLDVHKSARMSWKKTIKFDRNEVKALEGLDDPNEDLMAAQ